MSGPFVLTLGLDLRPQTTGAVQYALWLCNEASLQPAGHVYPVHVVVPEVMVELIRHADEATILGAFEQRGKEVLDEVAHGAHLHAPKVAGGDPVELLEDIARANGSTALVVSRRAKSDAVASFPRLGTVARKLLRRLKLPIIVAPPELLRSNVGEGPVVVAIDFSEGSRRAVDWAQAFADTIHRPMRLVHFADMPDQIGYAGVLQPDRFDELSEEILERGRERMSAFVDGYGLATTNTAVLRGPVLPALSDYADSTKACLLVTGSGHHGLLHRVIVPSVASETAAFSSVPVAVVP